MACADCFKGEVREGKPTGKIETVHGLKTYVAKPPGAKASKGVVVIISDAFGLPFVNNQLLADHYASAGDFTVYLPDFMNGREVPLSMMYNMAYLAEGGWLSAPYYTFAMLCDLLPHLWRNRMSITYPRVTAFLSALREETPLPIATAGFCWGGLHALWLAHDKPENKTKDGRSLIDASFVAHPSNVSMPGDVQKIVRPVSLAIGGEDALMGASQVTQAREILEGLKGGKGEIRVYPGARHGFAVRASRSKPDSKETLQAEEAESQAVEWFQKQFAVVGAKA